MILRTGHTSSSPVLCSSGGLNNQTSSEAGVEADLGGDLNTCLLHTVIDRDVLDTQYAFSLTYPTPGTFYTTGGSPPFTPDDLETTDSNEPYANVSVFDVSI